MGSWLIKRCLWVRGERTGLLAAQRVRFIRDEDISIPHCRRGTRVLGSRGSGRRTILLRSIQGSYLGNDEEDRLNSVNLYVSQVSVNSASLLALLTSYVPFPAR